MQMIGYAIGGIFVYLFYICCWYKLKGSKIAWKDWKLFFFGLIFIVFGTMITFYTTNFIKMILISILLFLICHRLIFHNVKQSLISVIIVQLIMMVSEVLFVLIISNFADLERLMKSILGCSLINIGIAFICFMIMLTPVPKKLYNLFCKLSDALKENKLIKYTLIMIIIASFLTTISYMHLDSKYVLIMNTIIVVIYIIIMFYVVKTQGKYQQIIEKYSSSITSLKEYENMIERYRVINHESKSELNTILEMVSNNDPDTVKHIEAILKTKVKENEKIMKQTSRIPSGGLRATIYSKICIMDNKNINYKLFVSNEIQPSELINLKESVILNICKILGVYLDNAIEAVEKMDEKNIAIELYKENEKFCIKITNNFKGAIDLNIIDKPGYTTKGDGHGYGLSLVNDIVSKDKNFSITKEINKDRFINILMIKLK